MLSSGWVKETRPHNKRSKQQRTIWGPAPGLCKEGHLAQLQQKCKKMARNNEIADKPEGQQNWRWSKGSEDEKKVRPEITKIIQEITKNLNATQGRSAFDIEVKTLEGCELEFKQVAPDTEMKTIKQMIADKMGKRAAHTQTMHGVHHEVVYADHLKVKQVKQTGTIIKINETGRRRDEWKPKPGGSFNEYGSEGPGDMSVTAQPQDNSHQLIDRNRIYRIKTQSN